jgi:anthranilate synthase component I
MMRPAYDEFQRLAAGGGLVPVWREILFDTETAVTAYAKLARPPFGFLLESVEGGETWARYTFLGTEPRAAWKVEAGGRVRHWSPGAGWGAAAATADPLAALEALLRAQVPVPVPGLPRFFGGAVGFLGYDAVRYIERLPDAPPDELGLPEALFLFTDVVLVIDNLFGTARVIATVDAGDGGPLAAGELRRRYDAAAARIDATIRRLAQAPAPAPLELEPEPEGAGGSAAGELPAGFTSSYDREGYEAHVRRIKEYIAAGDAFQVVLSQRLSGQLRARPLDVYRVLRSLNPSPYLYFLELDGVSLVGSSPEVLVRLEEGRVTVRPIAGTRPRGADAAEDARLAAELLADEKERAEHLMLVDLGRNDVGRVARYGTVTVPAFMTVERYSHVLHLVSQVEGELRDGLGAMDVFRACFPAGTVSGAPKIRAMEIIDELEPVRRGPYAGAVGYFAYGGESMDTAIAIRTLVAHQGQAHVQAGAGIVADSVPAREYEETLAKARALVRAVGLVGGAGDPAG